MTIDFCSANEKSADWKPLLPSHESDIIAATTLFIVDPLTSRYEIDPLTSRYEIDPNDGSPSITPQQYTPPERVHGVEAVDVSNTHPVFAGYKAP